MTYYDVLNGALAATCENTLISRATEDYIFRGQFLLANFVTQYARLDKQYRQANNLEIREIQTDMVSVDTEDEFPLSDVFIPVAIYFAASGFVLDENEEMSDKFFDRYVNGILEIRQGLPAVQS
ncbi:MAG: hypothetical protein IKV02_03465, partial [Clostridia bacterium]|nr:hypothetical protein [Clostridia bacterium]